MVDPEMEAFRAKLKQGGGMSREARGRWKRALPAILGLLIAAGIFGGIRWQERLKKEKEARAEEQARRDQDAAFAAERREADAYQARFAPIASALKGFVPTAFERADPALVQGRKVVGLQESGAVLLPRMQQVGGPGLAADAAQVGVVVFVKMTLHTDRPTRYEGGGARFPVTYDFTAIAWPEKKIVGAWRRHKEPPSSITGLRGTLVNWGGEGTLDDGQWRKDVDALTSGATPSGDAR